MGKVISKTFATLRQASRFHNRLMDKWESVWLVRSPMFTEYGTYVWNVRGAR
jgi:hypothetical protein